MNVSQSLMIKNDALYDKMKYLTQIVLPALGTLYFALSEIWGLPNGTEVVGTIVSLVTFLGIVLGISNTAYNQSDIKFDGAVNIVETEEKKVFTLDIQGDPYELENKNQIILKVNGPDG